MNSQLIPLIPIPFIFVGMMITWIARNKEDYKKVAIFQPITTILTVAVALLGLLTPNAVFGYTMWILAGLLLSLTGDIFNINMTKDNILFAALIVFFFAYLVYPIGITIYNGFHREDIFVAIGLLVVLIGLLSYIWKGLGKEWKIPVVLYAMVMLFMVHRAVSTFFGDFFSVTQAVLLTIGTSILFIADSEYSIHRFIKPFKFIIGPFLYPTGQLLIALSTSYFPGA